MLCIRLVSVGDPRAVACGVELADGVGADVDPIVGAEDGFFYYFDRRFIDRN